MRLLLFFFVFFFVSCFQRAATSPVERPILTKATSASTDPFIGITYIGNYDGDTFSVNLPDIIPDVFGKKISVRVRHIDTAEIDGVGKCEKDMSQRAKALTDSILRSAARIDLENVGRDKYFRILADAKITKQDGSVIYLSRQLLDAKLAVPYEGETKQKVDWCAMQKK